MARQVRARHADVESARPAPVLVVNNYYSAGQACITIESDGAPAGVWTILRPGPRRRGGWRALGAVDRARPAGRTQALHRSAPRPAAHPDQRAGGAAQGARVRGRGAAAATAPSR